VKFAKTAPQKSKNLNVAGQDYRNSGSKKSATSIFFNAFFFAVSSRNFPDAVLARGICVSSIFFIFSL